MLLASHATYPNNGPCGKGWQSLRQGLSAGRAGSVQTTEGHIVTMANVEPPKQPRRKRRWGDGPAVPGATDENPAQKGRFSSDGPQPHADGGVGSAPPPRPPPAAAPLSADPKARAAALQASIQARLAALKARTAGVASSTAPRPPAAAATNVNAGKRTAEAAPPTASGVGRLSKKAKVFELDMSTTASTRLLEKQKREERIRGGANKDDKPKVKRFVNPYLAHAEPEEEDSSKDKKGKKKSKEGTNEEVLLDSRLAGGHVAKTRLRSRPINFVAPGTYVALGEKKREAAARAEEGGYLSGRKVGNVVQSVGMGGAEDVPAEVDGEGTEGGTKSGGGYYGTNEAGTLLSDLFPPRADAPELELENYAPRKTILTSIGDVDLELNDEAVAAASEAAAGGLMPYAMEWWDAELLPSKLRKELAGEEGRSLALRNKKKLTGQQAKRLEEEDRDKTPAERHAIRAGRQADLVERCYKHASLGHSRTSALVQHPVPVLTPAQKAALALAKEKAPTLHLTKAERKRHRKLRRAERLREQQDLQAAGLVPPPEPRLTLSNYMKVMGDQAVIDPSKMESKVMEQIQARKMKHEKMNADRKLTKEEKSAKHRRKLAEDTSTGVHVALFWVADMGHPYHRAKVDLNAGQNSITGGVLECAERVNGTSVNLVVAEGGERAVKRYIRLMTVRMRWKGEDFYEDDDEEDGGEGEQDNGEEGFENLDDVDGPPDGEGGDGEAEEKKERKRFNPNNECQLVWTGMAMKRSFANFMFQSAATPTLARRVMEAKGVPHYWDRAVAHAEGRGEAGGGGGLGFRLG